MDCVDAIRAVKTMKPRYAIPMHYNTFKMIQQDPKEFKQKIKDSRKYPVNHFSVDNKPLSETIYTVKNRQYFLMGDNRDDSLDSRYWGFCPERYVVGEALIIYWSWDNEVPLYRLFNKIRWNRILGLIR